MSLPDSSILTNIQVTGRTRLADVLFEKQYITTRSLENRLYTDEEVIRLPEIAEDHTHFKEWQQRGRTMKRFLRYLARKRTDLDILEIGCGNGWLSHRLTEIPGTQVTGLDINFTELQQAARVFNDDPNLHFIHGDIRSGILDDLQFDCIVFSDTLQYFPSLKKIIYMAVSYLKPGGEVHITDTPLYRPAGLEAAKRASLAYYNSLGYPEMADFLFHHSSDDLRSFHSTVLFHRNNFGSRLWGNRPHCPWVRIKK